MVYWEIAMVGISWSQDMWVQELDDSLLIVDLEVAWDILSERQYMIVF